MKSADIYKGTSRYYSKINIKFLISYSSIISNNRDLSPKEKV